MQEFEIFVVEGLLYDSEPGSSSCFIKLELIPIQLCVD